MYTSTLSDGGTGIDSTVPCRLNSITSVKKLPTNRRSSGVTATLIGDQNGLYVNELTTLPVVAETMTTSLPSMNTSSPVDVKPPELHEPLYGKRPMTVPPAANRVMLQTF